MSLDQSLDSIIESSRKERRAARGGGGVHKARNQRGGGGRGGFREIPARVPRGNANDDWSHDLYAGGGGGGAGRTKVFVRRSAPSASGSKLMVSNLDFGVSDDDILELFERVGPVKKALINYDRAGRSLGTATVVFEASEHAMQAIRKYNNVQLDGKAMRIELVTSDTRAHVEDDGEEEEEEMDEGGYHHEHDDRAAEPRRVRGAGRQDFGGRDFGGRGFGGGRGGSRRGGGGGAGGRGGRSRPPKEPKKERTQESLDQELDSYFAAGSPQ